MLVLAAHSSSTAHLSAMASDRAVDLFNHAVDVSSHDADVFNHIVNVSEEVTKQVIPPQGKTPGVGTTSGALV
jgi:hypothetical protein